MKKWLISGLQKKKFKMESQKVQKKKEDGTCQKDTDGSLNGLLLAKFGIIKATT